MTSSNGRLVGLAAIPLLPSVVRPEWITPFGGYRSDRNTPQIKPTHDRDQGYVEGLATADRAQDKRWSPANLHIFVPGFLRVRRNFAARRRLAGELAAGALRWPRVIPTAVGGRQ
jgi:hypothetical protein